MFSTTKNTLIRIIRVLSVYASDTTLKKSVPIRKSFVLCASNPYIILYEPCMPRNSNANILFWGLPLKNSYILLEYFCL